MRSPLLSIENAIALTEKSMEARSQDAAQAFCPTIEITIEPWKRCSALALPSLWEIILAG
ncbi:MAG: hypothetical protein AAGD25_16635 [Cyanobacteria bacterium P01_F01_bin.150]